MRKTYLIATMALVLVLGQTAYAAECCEQYCTIDVAGGEYMLANNVWGCSTRQCIATTSGTGFTVSVSEHNNGTSVCSYPSIIKGCHWGDCTSSSGMPVQNPSSANFSWSVSSSRPTGNYNVACEAWLSPNSDSSGGYGGGAEVMIVLDYHNMYPCSNQQLGTFNGHQIHYCDVGWEFFTYVQTGRSSMSANMMDFINNAKSLSSKPSAFTYLHDMEAGFELCAGGAGLTSNSFSFSVGGGGGTTSTTASGTTSTTSGTTSTSTTANTTSTTTTTSNTTSTTSTTATGTTTTTAGGQTCSPVTAAISPSFTKDGSGTFCWTATSCSYINSWNLSTLTVNGVDFTNKYASGSQLPAKINGNWYIYYNGSYPWSHFELR